MNCAPAATFLARRCARHACGSADGFSAAPKNTRGAKRDLAAALEAVILTERSCDIEQRDAVQIEYRLRLRMIARLHAVAGQAQHVAYAHGGAAQDVALNGDAVFVAAGDLHDGRVADARQQRTHRDARHVAIGAAAVGSVDCIDIAVEHACALVDIFWIGGVRRRKLGGHGEPSCPQHALETAGRGVPGQNRQRVAGHRLVFEFHAVPSVLPGAAVGLEGAGLAWGSGFNSLTTRSHDERPCNR